VTQNKDKKMIGVQKYVLKKTQGQMRALTSWGGLKMKRGRKPLCAGLCASLVVTFMSAMVISGERLTITGTVNEDYEIVADGGTTYEVKSNQMGDEVVELVGKRVRVTGVVEEMGDFEMITVISYEVIGK
jgi:hypothetical protein